MSVACAHSRKEARKSLPPEQVYRVAMEKMNKKKYYSARNLLQQILPRIPPDDRDLLPKVQLAIADSYFKDRGLLNYGEALNGYRNFLTYYPSHEQAAYAQFMVGLSMFEQVLSPDRDQAMTLKAIEEFRKVEAVYPDSPLVVQARAQVDACLELLAEHERLVGRFYQKRKSYQAAIDRYRVVLDKYPRYKKTHEVLYNQGRCFLLVGNREDAMEYFERLWHEAPDSDWSRSARSDLAAYDRAEARRQKRGKK